MAVPGSFHKMLRPLRVCTAASRSVAIDPFLRRWRKPIALCVGNLQRLMRKADIEFRLFHLGVAHILEVAAPDVLIKDGVG